MSGLPGLASPGRTRAARRPGASPIGAVLALLAAALLAGCGFHLRGAETLPASMAATQVQGVDPAAPLYREIERALRSGGATLAETSGQASAVLAVLHNDMRRRVLSVSRGAQVSEYELNYVLRFELRTPEGKTLVAPQTVTLVRDYTFDPNQVLAKENEEALLREDMIRFAVQQMMRRLAAADTRSKIQDTSQNEGKTATNDRPLD